MGPTRGLVCAATAEKTPADLAQKLSKCADKIDVVEVRLDLMTDPDIDGCLEAAGQLPSLFTNRPSWEGGKFAGNEQNRIQPLISAAQKGATYVDIELKTEHTLRQKCIAACQNAGAKVIVSQHNFQETPSPEVLIQTLEDLIQTGAYAGKIITTAKSAKDVRQTLTLLSLAQDSNFPLSTFCMGEAGQISRFSTLYLGGFMSYAAINSETATAPGQLSVDHLHSLITLFEHHAH